MRGNAVVLVAALLIFSLPSFAARAAPSYVRATIIAAQEALARLGYDVGRPDGKWGAKSRSAMNEVRQKNGLPPADDFSGSSMALLHRLSPGETTLPRPGFFVVDVAARRAWLKEHPDVARSHCPAVIGVGGPLAYTKVMTDTLVDAAGQPGSADWFSRLGESIVGAQDACMAGDDKSCQVIVDTLDKWAKKDALRTELPLSDPRYENTKAAANYTLRGLIISYGLARQVTPLSPDREAAVLDWLKSRVDQFHHIFPDDHPYGDPRAHRVANHGTANFVPAIAFGILVGDRSMLEPGIEQWREALHYMRKDGSFPTEMNRGGAWFGYSGLQMAHMLSTQTLVAPQGIDIQGDLDPNRYSLRKALGFMLDAVQDFDVAYKYSKDDFLPRDNMTPRIPQISDYMLGFIPSYIARYGRDENITRMRTATIDGEICDASAQSEGKFSSYALCTPAKGAPISFGEAYLSTFPSPHWHMGYSAGCLEGTETWDALLAGR